MRAWGENIIVDLEEDSMNGDAPVKGTIVSTGEVVPGELEEGLVVIFGKYAGQQLDNSIILNYNEIMAIDE